MYIHVSVVVPVPFDSRLFMSFQPRSAGSSAGLLGNSQEHGDQNGLQHGKAPPVSVEGTHVSHMFIVHSQLYPLFKKLWSSFSDTCAHRRTRTAVLCRPAQPMAGSCSVVAARS